VEGVIAFSDITGKPNAHRGQLPLNPSVAPGRILLCQAKDQRDRACWNAGSSLPSVRVGPLPSHQRAVPAQQGLGPDEEASLASSRQKPTQSSEYRSIRWSQGRTGHLAAQDGDLVAKDDDLDGQVLLLTPRETYQLEHADEGKVEEGERHAPSSSR